MSTTEIIQHEWTGDCRLRNFKIEYHIDHPVDLVFSDPPYNIGVKYADDPHGDRLSEDDYFNWVDHVVFQLKNMIRSGGTLWWLCPAEHGNRIWSILTKYSWLLYGKPIIWYERFSQYQQRRLTSDYRLLFPLKIGSEEPIFNADAIREPSIRQEMGDSRADPRGRVPGHVWQVRRLQGTATARIDWHPAQLAPEGLERIVQGWTRPGETVLDAFAGSGSMGLACRKLGRNFVGVERSTEYCRRMRERLACE
jgi:adenine-specific DNA-methyltransferase